MERRFTRKIEDFICDHCGSRVEGNGYTNHCPKCLWSKHVDIHPGDRAEGCKGMMEPCFAIKEGERHSIIHKCTRCGFERRNSLQKDDDFDMYIALTDKAGR